MAADYGYKFKLAIVILLFQNPDGLTLAELCTKLCERGTYGKINKYTKTNQDTTRMALMVMRQDNVVNAVSEKSRTKVEYYIYSLTKEYTNEFKNVRTGLQ